MTRILCLYLPSDHAGLRALVQIHDTATLSLKDAPTDGAAFDVLLLGCGYSGGSPRVSKEAWTAGHTEVYLAEPLGSAYIGTSLLSGEEQQHGQVLYPWRQGVRPTGRLEGVQLAQLPEALSEALRASGIQNKAVLTELSGEGPDDMLEQAAGSRVDPVWESGPNFRAGRATRQTRGTGRATPDLDEKRLQAYAQAHFRALLEAEGYVFVEPGPTASSAIYRDPAGQTVHAHVHASVSAAATVPLTRGERFWHKDHLSLLGVLHDVHLTQGTCSGGRAVLVRDWTIEDDALRPTRYDHRPGTPTDEVIIE